MFERGLFLRSVICLHRIYTELLNSYALSFQQKIGMSISITALRNRISSLNQEVRSNLLVTIDDGHRDILRLVPLIKEFSIQSIVFMTSRQLRGEVKALPLTALYAWCVRNQTDPNMLKEELGFDRLLLKHLRQDEQERLLAEADIPLDPEEERMLDTQDIRYLISNGFKVGYHGPEHCDLRTIPPDELQKLFEEDFCLFKKDGYTPELAWPEGWWNEEISDIAYRTGFEKQYGLSSTRFVDASQVIWARSIWKCVSECW